MIIFVGNLSFDAVEADVQKLFEGFGNVASVVIVMRKEKNGPKSRGFGFVEMPDEQQALAAIAAFNGKEFMGRVLNVDPARSKTGAQAGSEVKERRPPKITPEVEPHPREDRVQKKTLNSPVFNKPGANKGGKRRHSYMERQGVTGRLEEAKPRRKKQDNPMRRHKRADQPKPWPKSSGEHKPGKKAGGNSKPWSKSSKRPQKSRFKGRKKPGRYKR